MRISVVLWQVFLLTLALLLCCGCTSELPESNHKTVSSVGGVRLTPYTDTASYFSLQKPADWTVSVEDAIIVQDPADGGITQVRIQPIFLSGSYRSLTAGSIANYLVGQVAGYYEGFDVVSARETTDRSMIEMVASFSEKGVKKQGCIRSLCSPPMPC